MKKELIQEFTRRITQCNRGEMIIIIYDIIFAYAKDAVLANEQGEYGDFKEALGKAQNGIEELIHALDFQYPIAAELYPLYVFCKECMAKSIIKNNVSDLEDAVEVLTNLYEAFQAAAGQDASEPLMKNTQRVYAGMTYGKNDLTETFQEPETSRGFFA